MPCFSPLEGYWSKHLTRAGRRKVVFSTNDGYQDRPIVVPCGQCIGCRVDKTTQWAIRCVHESYMSTSSWFVTLTYNEENLPPNASVSKEEHQLFMKKLRYYLPEDNIRFFMCGEYGDRTSRPHYHYLLFNASLMETNEFHRTGISKYAQDGYPIYRNRLIEKIWNKGFSELGEVNIRSAQYVAGYVRKKITGKNLDKIDPETGLKPYEVYDSKTGLIIKRHPEFSLMSRRPGIGSTFYQKYKDQILRNDFVVNNGKRLRVPKYYDRLTSEENPERYSDLQYNRRRNAKKRESENTRQRLAHREQFTHNVINRGKRSAI